FQLLNAVEAIHVFPAQQNDVQVRFSDSGKNDAQLKSLLQEISFSKNVIVKTFFIKSEKRSGFDFLKMCYYFLKFRLLTTRYKHVFIGNYDSRLIQLIIPFTANTILLDDGLKTINIQKNFTPKKFYDWFTIFDLKPVKGQKIYSNQLTNLRTHIDKHGKKRKTILFIGSKLSEEKIISEDYNIEIIKRAISHYSESSITYVAHRSESQRKLNKIQQIQNVEVLQLPYPLELLPMYGEFSPTVIISFFSTALITLSKIYNVETIGYKFDFSKYPHRDNIENAYKYCSQFITVKELPL
ncbi:MAG: polysialyltransferase family glycosyltransferase, partial [Salibacteraceae bacterium]